jgi:multiple sugar transport system permease protein
VTGARSAENRPLLPWEGAGLSRWFMMKHVPARGKNRLRKYGIGLAFLAPALLVFTVFQWVPILGNFFLAFTDYSPGIDAEWIGFANYRSVFNDPLLPRAVLNTLTYVGICLVIGYCLPIAAAIAISEIRRGRGFFRLAIYIPNIIPAIATYIIWRWIFNPDFGLLNQILGFFDIAPQPWIVSRSQVLVSLSIMATWQGFGSTAVLYMASLTSINPELYEAAELDGAGFLQRVRSVTLPSLAPTMKLLLVLQLIATFQVLQEPFVMTSGGPNNASLSVMLLAYRYAFSFIDFGRAGALGSLLFVVMIGLSIFYVRKSGLADAKGA